MYVLGLGGSNHDQSAALVKDGKLIVAIEDERVVRNKKGVSHWAGRPCLAAMQYCLKAAGIALSDIDEIFVNDDIDTAFPFWEDHRHTLVPHHLNHAMSAFLNSPYESSALLVIDGKGTRVNGASNDVFETVSIGSGSGNTGEIGTFQSGKQRLSTASWRFVVENSLGWFYRTISDAIGFGQSGEGKTMGLASYGKPRFAREISEFIDFDDDGRFFYDAYGGLWDWLVDTIEPTKNCFQIRADIAASGQALLEKGVLLAATHAYEMTGSKNLCYAGGVGLNGVANFRLQTETPFESVFLWPPCGDNGLAIGAALYGYYLRSAAKRTPLNAVGVANSAYCGVDYQRDEILRALQQVSVTYVEVEDSAAAACGVLQSGEPLAVFQGGSEIGPRALGHRSILADPTCSKMRDRLNKIKRRESFRPFAPIVLERDMKTYFDVSVPSPFMLSIAPVRAEYRAMLPAITHVDNTARLQTVPDGGDSFLIDLLNGLKDLGRPPIVLNTSFNLSGEPIVETPADALNAFLRLEINEMLIGPFLVSKHSPFATRH